MKISYRPIRESEFSFLDEMLFEAIYVPEGKPKPSKTILKTSEISKYLESWNQKEDDLAIVALDNNILIGAIWGRKFHPDNIGYGYVDHKTPEIGMAVKREYRNQGIGTKLIDYIEKEYAKSGIERLSLSVDKLNPAKRLYEKCGYILYSDNEVAITMVKDIT